MADPRKCPLCDAPMVADADFSDFACPQCGLAAPVATLDTLAKRLSPAGVLNEALRILRERGSPLLYPAAGGALACKGGKWADGKDICAVLDALDAKLKLVGGRDAR